MKIVFIGGTHPRHAHIARALEKSHHLKGIILEQREIFTQVAPKNIDEHLKSLFTHHFQSREKTELSLLGEPRFPEVDRLTIAKDELNQHKVHHFLKRHDPDLLLTYGCHKLSEETLACVRGEKWNCHGGLSPWYKGAITHFWPSYMLEPQMTGMTVHDLTTELDAGAVIHQCCAPLERGDKLHDLAAKAVKQLAIELPQLLDKLSTNQKIEKKRHSINGMLWLGNMWRPEHLELIYNQYSDRIVDYYLEGKFQQKEPKLHRQF